MDVRERSGANLSEVHQAILNASLCLGRICDDREHASEKAKLASWYVGLPDCCQSRTFCKPLLALTSNPKELCPGGRLFGVLMAAMRSKNTNIQLEDNFARAQSAKVSTRGREDHSTMLAAKHLLAEIKVLHVKDVLRQAEQQYSSAVQAEPLLEEPSRSGNQHTLADSNATQKGTLAQDCISCILLIPHTLGLTYILSIFQMFS